MIVANSETGEKVILVLDKAEAQLLVDTLCEYRDANKRKIKLKKMADQLEEQAGY